MFVFLKSIIQLLQISNPNRFFIATNTCICVVERRDVTRKGVSKYVNWTMLAQLKHVFCKKSCIQTQKGILGYFEY